MYILQPLKYIILKQINFVSCMSKYRALIIQATVTIKSQRILSLRAESYKIEQNCIKIEDLVNNRLQNTKYII